MCYNFTFVVLAFIRPSHTASIKVKKEFVGALSNGDIAGDLGVTLGHP